MVITYDLHTRFLWWAGNVERHNLVNNTANRVWIPADL